MPKKTTDTLSPAEATEKKFVIISVVSVVLSASVVKIAPKVLKTSLTRRAGRACFPRIFHASPHSRWHRAGRLAKQLASRLPRPWLMHKRRGCDEALDLHGCSAPLRTSPPPPKAVTSHRTPRRQLALSLPRQALASRRGSCLLRAVMACVAGLGRWLRAVRFARNLLRPLSGTAQSVARLLRRGLSARRVGCRGRYLRPLEAVSSGHPLPDVGGGDRCGGHWGLVGRWRAVVFVLVE